MASRAFSSALNVGRATSSGRVPLDLRMKMKRLGVTLAPGAALNADNVDGRNMAPEVSADVFRKSLLLFIIIFFRVLLLRVFFAVDEGV